MLSLKIFQVVLGLQVIISAHHATTTVQAHSISFNDITGGNLLFTEQNRQIPYEVKTRVIRSAEPDDELVDEIFEELEADPRKELNEFESEDDPRKKLDKQEDMNTVKVIETDSTTNTNTTANTNTTSGISSSQDQITFPKRTKSEFILPDDYDNLEIPRLWINGTFHQVPVYQVLLIRSMLAIDETEEKIKIEIDTFVTWADGHLYTQELENANKKDPTLTDNVQAIRPLNPLFLKKIWRPDIYIDGLLSVDKPSYMSSPVSLKYNPSVGGFIYTSRIALTLKCPMEFNYYPADTQTCRFRFRSYGYHNDSLGLAWAQEGVIFGNPDDSNFDVQANDVKAHYVAEPYIDKVRYYDTLEFSIQLRRKLSYHLVQTYLPSIFFIIITWLSFLLPTTMIEGRIAIVMTTLLSLTAMFASVRESTPSVSYVKAIDIWMIACIIFVFFTLLEFAVLAWVETDRKRLQEAAEKKRELRQQNGNGHLNGRKRHDSSELHEQQQYVKDDEGQLPDLPVHFYENCVWCIEKFAFIIFCVLFTIFTVVYWVWLLVEAEYFTWEVNPTFNRYTTK